MKPEDKISLNEFSAACDDLISTSKSSYYSNLANKLNNPMSGPKSYWSILNRFLGKKKIPTILPLKKINDIFETNFLTKSNIFNKYFAKQCSIIDNGSVLPNITYITDSRINEVLLSREFNPQDYQRS